MNDIFSKPKEILQVGGAEERKKLVAEITATFYHKPTENNGTGEGAHQQDNA